MLSRVAWGMRFNHGGGYQYRLCPLEKMPCTEEQFQEMPLQFVRDEQAIVSLSILSSGVLESKFDICSRCGTTAPSTPSKECSLTIPSVQWCPRALPGLVTRFLESTPTTLGWPLSGDVGVKTVPLERFGECPKLNQCGLFQVCRQAGAPWCPDKEDCSNFPTPCPDIDRGW